jgi:hypothetical protein
LVTSEDRDGGNRRKGGVVAKYHRLSVVTSERVARDDRATLLAFEDFMRRLSGHEGRRSCGIARRKRRN